MIEKSDVQELIALKTPVYAVDGINSFKRGRIRLVSGVIQQICFEEDDTGFSGFYKFQDCFVDPIMAYNHFKLNIDNRIEELRKLSEKAMMLSDDWWKK